MHLKLMFYCCQLAVNSFCIVLVTESLMVYQLFLPLSRICITSLLSLNLLVFIFIYFYFIFFHVIGFYQTFQDQKLKLRGLRGSYKQKIGRLLQLPERSETQSFTYGNYFLLDILLEIFFLELLYQEAKATAAFKAQIEKLQQERDEFQRMVIGNQVSTFGFIGVSTFGFIGVSLCCLHLPYENGGNPDLYEFLRVFCHSK